MIDYQEFTLENGLRVLVHEDPSVSVAVTNILYDVGSRDEKRDKTGFAHLFEHLMFGGSANVPSYDTPLQKVGGDNNAFTSPDLTNYYVTVPPENLETAFWLESDRMLSLSFDPQVLNVQKKVVIEEYKQRYLNQPYGDVWLKLRPLAYRVHPYSWPTIGADISHIEDATMDDVQTFFYQYYRPNNAVMVVAGQVTLDEVKRLSEKWFGSIPKGNIPVRNLPQEPEQHEVRVQEVVANVPVGAVYKSYHMCGKMHPDYYATDLLNDILGRGKSSRLYQALVKDRQIFSSISTSIAGSVDPGMFLISGKLAPGISPEQGDAAIQEVVDQFCDNPLLEPNELEKVKNQSEASLIFGEMEVLSRAMNLAFSANLGDPNLANLTGAMIQAVTQEQIATVAKQILLPTNSSTLYYRSAQ